MSLARLSLSSRRALAARPFTSTSVRLLSTTHTRYAAGDYGSGTGDPKGDRPQDQGPNPSADKEHPGPPPPKVGQDTGSGPTKGTSDGHNTPGSGINDKPGSGGPGKRPFSTSARKLYPSVDDSISHDAGRSERTKDAKPKILADSPPQDEDAPDAVRKHNEELGNRAEKAHESVANDDTGKDKVGKGFWSGTGGADRQP